jgi:hypothetical protein
MRMELAHMLDTQDLDDPELSALKDRFLSLISSRGLMKSEELMQIPDWDAESYWYVGKLLIDAGVLRADGEKSEKLRRIDGTPPTAGSIDRPAVMRKGRCRCWRQ